MKNKKIYLAGDMLKYGSQLQREEEKKQILELGYDVHSPKDDKEINDKQDQTEESNNGLAEKIVRNDTEGIVSSDIIVIEPHENALGTICELGQIKGMRDAYKSILNFFSQYDTNTANTIYQVFNDIFNKKVYPYVRDIRRTGIPECGDRRSWGINQYIYGVCLNLTNGKGLYEWGEILEDLKKNNN